MTDHEVLHHDEVEKAGGAPVREGPATTPEQALDSTSADESASEPRPDVDQAGHEPHPGGDRNPS